MFKKTALFWNDGIPKETVEVKDGEETVDYEEGLCLGLIGMEVKIARLAATITKMPGQLGDGLDNMISIFQLIDLTKLQLFYGSWILTNVSSGQNKGAWLRKWGLKHPKFKTF